MEGFVRGQIKTVLEKAFKISESDTAEPSVTFVTMKIFEIAKAVDRMDRIEKTLNETAATLRDTVKTVSKLKAREEAYMRAMGKHTHMSSNTEPTHGN